MQGLFGSVTDSLPYHYICDRRFGFQEKEGVVGGVGRWMARVGVGGVGGWMGWWRRGGGVGGAVGGGGGQGSAVGGGAG